MGKFGIKKTLCIFMLVLFVASVTAASVSAGRFDRFDRDRDDFKFVEKEKFKFVEKEKFTFVEKERCCDRDRCDRCDRDRCCDRDKCDRCDRGCKDKCKFDFASFFGCGNFFGNDRCNWW